jgi:hypothetical protein
MRSGLEGHLVKFFCQVKLIFIFFLICDIYIDAIFIIIRHFQLLNTVLIVPDLSKHGRDESLTHDNVL